MNRYQKQFDDAITAQHSTYTPMNMSDKPEQYWKEIEAPAEDPLKAVQDKLTLSIFGEGETAATNSLANALSAYGINASEYGYSMTEHFVQLSPPEGSEVKPIVVKVKRGTGGTDRADAQKQVLDFMKEVLNEKKTAQGGQQGGKPNTSQYNTDK